MIQVQVISRRDEALGICSFELGSIDAAELPAFSPGAHVDVHLPGGMIRQYSLCNDPRERHRYVIGVLHDPASRGGSRALHEQIVVGQRLDISAPRNLFELASEASRSLLFAGGIGITPMLCMAEYLAYSGADFTLHYCARSRERAAFIARLREAPFADRVLLHFDEEPTTALQAAAVLAEPAEGTHLYVCGPGGFMQHVLETARQQGWKESTLHREYFAAAPVDTTRDGSFAIRLASSGQVFQVPANETVVQVLQRHGVEIPVSCEQGICGTCLTGVLEGTPEHRDLYLSEAEQARNDQFTPCCSRAHGALLVLDL